MVEENITFKVDGSLTRYYEFWGDNKYWIYVTEPQKIPIKNNIEDDNHEVVEDGAECDDELYFFA